MENNTFFYSYSAIQNKEIKRIRQKYLPRYEDDIERLKALDRRVRGSGAFAAIASGVVGILLFGGAMCILLGEIEGSIAVGVTIGCIGAALMLAAYPIHLSIYERTRKKLAPLILSLAEKIESQKK